MIREVKCISWRLTVCAALSLVPLERGFAQESGAQYSITIQNEIKAQETALLQRIQILSLRMRNLETTMIKEISRLADKNVLSLNKAYDDYVTALLDTGFNLIGGAVAGKALNRIEIMKRLNETDYLNGLGGLLNNWAQFFDQLGRANAGKKELSELRSRLDRETAAMVSEMTSLRGALQNLEREKASLRLSGRLPAGPRYDPVLDTFTMQAPDRSVDFSPGSWNVYFDLEDTAEPWFTIVLTEKSDAESMLRQYMEIKLSEIQPSGHTTTLKSLEAGLMEAVAVFHYADQNPGTSDYDYSIVVKRVGETFILMDGFTAFYGYDGQKFSMDQDLFTLFALRQQ